MRAPTSGMHWATSPGSQPSGRFESHQPFGSSPYSWEVSSLENMS